MISDLTEAIGAGPAHRAVDGKAFCDLGIQRLGELAPWLWPSGAQLPNELGKPGVIRLPGSSVQRRVDRLKLAAHLSICFLISKPLHRMPS
jgi:hypothetical protein